jgi:hypothetical protein
MGDTATTTIGIQAAISADTTDCIPTRTTACTRESISDLIAGSTTIGMVATRMTTSRGRGEQRQTN